ncbi:MAG: SDR family oxidoreductase [Agathobacter sp.]|nr:SDR family oxidoreductase [Agathobacter sp.]
MKPTVLITGASRGIGKSIAYRFAKEGFSLVINCSKSKKELLTLQEDLMEKFHIPVYASVGNIGDPLYVKQLFDEIHNQGSRVDILVNNAGISHIGLLSDMTVEEWQHIMDVNLSSVFYTSKLAIPDMLSKKSGKIINISSVWGNIGASCEVAYSASKGGVNSFTKALAKELAPSNIQVNAIACGCIDTAMNQCFSEEERQDLINEIPSGRFGTPEEVADLVYALTNEHSFLTGQVITLDGGWS